MACIGHLRPRWGTAPAAGTLPSVHIANIRFWLLDVDAAKELQCATAAALPLFLEHKVGPGVRLSLPQGKDNAGTVTLAPAICSPHFISSEAPLTVTLPSYTPFMILNVHSRFKDASMPTGRYVSDQ